MCEKFRAPSSAVNRLVVTYMAMITVDGVEMPCPSAFTWGLQDISAAESGRTDDALMHKNRVAQKRKISLRWNGKSCQETAKILQAFNPEYVSVRYPDKMSGVDETRTFYTGDKTAPVKTWQVGKKIIESISFDIVER